jgi:hypothetical protein
MATCNPEAGPVLLHGHDQKTLSRQEQTRLGPAKRFQLPQDCAVPPIQIPERSYVRGP